MTPKRIDFGIAFLLVALALVIDGVQFLLTLTVVGSVASPVLSVLAWTLFFIIFAMLGVSYFDKDGAVRLLTAFASIVTELVPIINALPALTLGVVVLIFQHNRKVAKEERKQRRPRTPRAANDNQRQEAREAA